MILTTEAARWLMAGGVGLSYAVFCCFFYFRARQRVRHRRTGMAGGESSGTILVAYASQSGFAEEMATRAHDALVAGGQQVLCLPLNDVDANVLSRAGQALFLVSTAGEGDAPDNALLFVESLMVNSCDLGHLHYGLLALGDRTYAKYCGFGRNLQCWLDSRGARAMFESIEVDRGESIALQRWSDQLMHLAGSADMPDWEGPSFDHWRITERRCLNPVSLGAPVFHLELKPLDPANFPRWEAGDLVQVLPPLEGERPREYSIASIPSDESIHLLVRQHRYPTGQLGVTSGWLTKDADLNVEIALRWRAHRNFRLGGNVDRPLILIGNGTGIAALRSHIRARAKRGDGRNWLIFGERNISNDYFYGKEIEDWQAKDLLARVDLAFSRDQRERCYVQDILYKASLSLREWVADEAAIYVCGSASGMAAGVDAALVEILGQATRDDLLKCGRYRRDIY